jgi:Ca-activated chloride channel family protein
VIARSRPASQESLSLSITPSTGNHRFGKPHLFLAPLLFSFGIFGLSASPAIVRPPSRADDPPQIKVAVNLVLMPASVTDARGSFVPGLKREDFRVLEEGQLQKLTVFEEGDTPVTVGLIVDHSRSMGSKLPNVGVAISSFAHSSNPQDEMFVVDFNDDVSIERMGGKSFSNDPKDLEKALTAVSARGRTALYDAVSQGLTHLQSGHLSRKALIIISDGGDNASHLRYAEVLAQARQSQAAIYSIALVSAEQGEDENPGILRRLCKDTGGVAYFPGAHETVAQVSLAIARDLREQYTLGYISQQASGSNSFRKIEVKVSTPEHGRLRVRTRPGYSPSAEKQPAGQSGSGTR